MFAAKKPEAGSSSSTPMSEEETTAQKWLHALHLDNEMDECEGGRSSNPSLKSVRHSKRDDSWTSFTFTALPDTIEEFRVRPTNRIPCRSFTLGCGWGIGSGAIAAVRLPKILVLKLSSFQAFKPSRGGEEGHAKQPPPRGQHGKPTDMRPE